jgi:hypothetical protein
MRAVKKVIIKKPETILQQNCVTLFRLQYPKLEKRFYSIPNGGKRHISVAKQLKAEGALAGALDTFLSVPRGKWHGMYIEFKAIDGRLSDAQQDFIAANGEDYYCVVVRTVDQFMREVKQYLSLLK